MAEKSDDDQLVLVGAKYWAENPDELAEALKELTGVDAPAIALKSHRRDEVLRVARIPLDVVGELILQRLFGSTRPIPPTPRLTLTVEEAAKALGISRAFAYEAVQRGEIPHIRIGRRILVPKAQLDRLLAGGSPTS
jgi:excisionase family DNA binding protein